MIQLLFKYKKKAYLLFWYAFLILIHFIIKDRFQPIVFIFNATPLLFIIAYGIFLSFIVRKHKIVLFTIIFINCLLGLFWYNNYVFKTEDVKEDIAKTRSILFWNISRPKHLPIDKIFEKAKTYNPEILVFVEAKKIPQEDLIAFKNKYPLYDIQQLQSEMLIAVKGKINETAYKRISTGSNCNLVTATIRGEQVKILINDLFANPALSKKADFETIQSIIQTEQVNFIVGDFNTPYESAFFELFKSNFESFHAYNNGVSATWPSRLPILEIDHIWISKAWKPLILHKEFNEYSDHGLLIGTYRLRR
ncbi:endonuclease/exonuclease/phosphatase family protein [Formosa algae]|uniref:Endonuclease/exonuclease/phosphatase (EEP) superfamily protein YafD n=1 Tax=Formosa algae TaxID=225843 RepID=A0A9X0YJP5_9FLAO|nr:endonuclease/exonuclease/phosphatase family protein [Formosa algae]MBP1838116.1 endonuclease/exonuclease/phosphatase (EEP) superfamily protein YafD [Formosa algae]MDQ0334251.1 endonuclease/exonuclease/phosphatase (EEP) superfamily protein YafD [Formosa algae]